MAEEVPKTIIIGLGNPILGDDGVGWKVAQEVEETIEMGKSHFGNGIEIEYSSLGGLSLMERMVGFQRVILIDSMHTDEHPIGSVRTFPLNALANPMDGHSASAHDTSLRLALETAEEMGVSVPRSVEVVAIESNQVFDFSENLSPAVAAAIPLATQCVINLLGLEES